MFNSSIFVCAIVLHVSVFNVVDHNNKKTIRQKHKTISLQFFFFLYNFFSLLQIFSRLLSCWRKKHKIKWSALCSSDGVVHLLLPFIIISSIASALYYIKIHHCSIKKSIKRNKNLFCVIFFFKNYILWIVKNVN